MKQINLVATLFSGSSMLIYNIAWMEGLSLFKFADPREEFFFINTQIYMHIYMCN